MASTKSDMNVRHGKTARMGEHTALALIVGDNDVAHARGAIAAITNALSLSLSLLHPLLNLQPTDRPSVSQARFTARYSCRKCRPRWLLHSIFASLALLCWCENVVSADDEQ